MADCVPNWAMADCVPHGANGGLRAPIGSAADCAHSAQPEPYPLYG
jgi:hypothetical protein